LTMLKGLVNCVIPQHCGVILKSSNTA